MADVNDIYRGILKPGGGVFEPGPPVMLPPQGMGSSDATRKVIAALVGANVPGDGPNWGMLDDQMSGDAYPVRSMADIGREIGYPINTLLRPDLSTGDQLPILQALAAEAAGSTDLNKNQDRLSTGSPLLAFDGDQNTGVTIFPPGTVPVPMRRPSFTSGVQSVVDALEPPGPMRRPDFGGAVQPPQLTNTDPWLGMRAPGEAVVKQPGLTTGTPPGVQALHSRLMQQQQFGVGEQVGHRPHDLASGNPAIRDNQIATYTKRQAQVDQGGTFTGHSGQVFTPGERVVNSRGQTLIAQPDGSFAKVNG